MGLWLPRQSCSFNLHAFLNYVMFLITSECSDGIRRRGEFHAILQSLIAAEEKTCTKHSGRRGDKTEWENGRERE